MVGIVGRKADNQPENQPDQRCHQYENGQAREDISQHAIQLQVLLGQDADRVGEIKSGCIGTEKAERAGQGAQKSLKKTAKGKKSGNCEQNKSRNPHAYNLIFCCKAPSYSSRWRL